MEYFTAPERDFHVWRAGKAAGREEEESNAKGQIPLILPVPFILTKGDGFLSLQRKLKSKKASTRDDDDGRVTPRNG